MTRCRRLHPLTDANTYRRRDGRLECRRCKAMRERARYRAGALGLPVPRFHPTHQRRGAAQQQEAR